MPSKKLYQQLASTPTLDAILNLDNYYNKMTIDGVAQTK